MSVKGPIIIIEDDSNDMDVIKAALLENKVENEFRCFISAGDALEYLMVTPELPFLILCDIKLPGMNGLEFRKTINDNDFLRKKSIPFLFYTAAVSQQIIDIAYDLTVQGFFEKPYSFDETKQQLGCIISYWKKCMHPNSFTH